MGICIIGIYKDQSMHSSSTGTSFYETHWHSGTRGLLTHQRLLVKVLENESNYILSTVFPNSIGYRSETYQTENPRPPHWCSARCIVE